MLLTIYLLPEIIQQNSAKKLDCFSSCSLLLIFRCTMQNVDVICQIKNNGSIIPFRVKLEDDEQQLQIFKIKRNKPPKETFKNEFGYHSNSNMSYSNFLEIEFVIEEFKLRN